MKAKALAIALTAVMVAVVFACTRAPRGLFPLPPPADGPGPVHASAPLPEFRLPAPRPSSMTTLPLAGLAGPGASLGSVADALEGVLDRAGYADRSFFRVRGGFAIATRMERIHQDGSPFPGPTRWRVGPAGLLAPGASIITMCHDLLDADPGRYRMLVVLVTDVPVTGTGAAPTSEQAAALVTAGASALPYGYGRTRVSPGHRATVLIYEFGRAAVGNDPLPVPSVVPAATQLRLSGVSAKPSAQ